MRPRWVGLEWLRHSVVEVGFKEAQAVKDCRRLRVAGGDEGCGVRERMKAGFRQSNCNRVRRGE